MFPFSSIFLFHFVAFPSSLSIFVFLFSNRRLLPFNCFHIFSFNFIYFLLFFLSIYLSNYHVLVFPSLLKFFAFLFISCVFLPLHCLHSHFLFYFSFSASSVFISSCFLSFFPFLFIFLSIICLLSSLVFFLHAVVFNSIYYSIFFYHQPKVFQSHLVFFPFFSHFLDSLFFSPSFTCFYPPLSLMLLLSHSSSPPVLFFSSPLFPLFIFFPPLFSFMFSILLFISNLK